MAPSGRRYGVARGAGGPGVRRPRLSVLSQLGASSHPLTVWAAFIPMAFGVATMAPR